jgi:formylglycine-generating enzyme required for sulfatase activity
MRSTLSTGRLFFVPLVGLLAISHGVATRAHAAAAPAGMVFVPGGELMMGSADGNADEAPVHRVRVSSFFIDRDEVTNEQFAEFVRSTGKYEEIEGSWFRYYAQACRDLIAFYGTRQSPRRKAAEAALKAIPEGDQAKLPVRGVTWRDAVAYTAWAGKRLPTEAEWELAARGREGRVYPWGDEWQAGLSRAGLAADAGPVAVGSFPAGASPYGCHDMAGNVWEWVADWYGESYYATVAGQSAANPKGPVGPADGRLPPPPPDPDSDSRTLANQGRETDTRKVIRGGGWSGARTGQARFDTRAARRLWSNPGHWHPDVGFRCAKDAR